MMVDIAVMVVWGGSTVDKESKFIFWVSVFSSKSKILSNSRKKGI